MSTKKVKRTERGWAGHFIGSANCLFRRNTLLEYNGVKVVVSTVGLYRVNRVIEEIGVNRYYETMAFYVKKNDKYNDADVLRKITFNSPWSISKIHADIEANDMHENVVKEIKKKLLKRELK